MNLTYPNWAKPLNVFQIHGTMCCQNMRISYASKLLVEHFMCYDARSMYDANLVILWGSFSKKLAALILEQVQAMPGGRVLMHIRGCDRRIENDISSSSLSMLPINTVFSNCVIHADSAKALIHEARLCLKA